MKRIIFLIILLLFTHELEFAHVSLIAPTSNQSFAFDEVIKIEWAIVVDHGPATWTLEYSIDNGTNWITIGSEIEKKTLMLQWTIPAISTNEGAIRIIQVNDNGGRYIGMANNLTFGTTTSVDNELLGFQNFKLNNSYPNPFNNGTVISYHIPYESYIQLLIYDLKGSKIEILKSEIEQSGNHELIWNANGFVSGVYILMLKSRDYYSSKKLILLK